jgi:hypothetical protein
MSKTEYTQSDPIRRIIRKVAEIIAECSYAQRRMTALATAPDRFIAAPDQAPDDYAEFLFRTSGALRHEPSARARERFGKQVC